MRHAVPVGVFLAAALATPASAAPLTATQIRVGEHPAFARVVVEFTGGALTSSELAATDPDPFPDGFVRVTMIHAGVRSTAAPVRANGLFARVGQAGSRLTVRVTGRDRRLKYVSYVIQHAPERLVIDLYKSRPPKGAAEIVTGRRSCLTLGSHKLTRKRVKAAGGERNVFEHMFLVRLRRHGGGIHRQKTVTAVHGSWSTSFAYPHARRQTGTLEAVEFSSKDGALDCLVQVRVRFGG